MTQVDVGDVVLVRTLLQISIYVSILLYREERFLPESNSQKLYTILQGNNHCYGIFPTFETVPYIYLNYRV